MEKNDVRPAGGWAGGWSHAFFSGPLCQKTFILSFMKFDIYLGLMLYVVPYGGHIAIAYSFPIIIKNVKKIIFFSFPDQNY